MAIDKYDKENKSGLEDQVGHLLKYLEDQGSIYTNTFFVLRVTINKLRPFQSMLF